MEERAFENYVKSECGLFVEKQSGRAKSYCC